VKHKSTTIKTSWPALAAIYSKERWIGAYSIGLIIPGKLGCPNNNNKKKKNAPGLIASTRLNDFFISGIPFRQTN
jgi:hypothetical protein